MKTHNYNTSLLHLAVNRGVFIIYYLIMKKEKQVVEDFLFELMRFMSDNKGRISEKKFIKWYEIYDFFLKKYDRAATSNEN